MLALLALAASAVTPDREGSLLNRPDRGWDVGAVAELGHLAPLAHTLQLSQSGSRVDLVREGGDPLSAYCCKLCAATVTGGP
jgi:hypothetical protein